MFPLNWVKAIRFCIFFPSFSFLFSAFSRRQKRSIMFMTMIKEYYAVNKLNKVPMKILSRTFGHLLITTLSADIKKSFP